MHTTLAWIDYLIMVIYFAFVLGIGFALKRFMKTSTDFFLSGRSIPAWVAGLAFISANLGAQEVIGMAASGAKYGIATSHFYWLGAIPAMVFVGLFMMPFYYGSRARSVPEYLRLRFDEKTRGLNAITFAAMTVMSSGISMYAMAKLIETLHIFDPLMQALGLPMSYIFHLSIVVSALITLGYVYLGGLTSAIYNEVLQFFLIVAGFFPLVWLGLKNVGGWDGLVAKTPAGFGHAWKGMTNAETNPLGVEWFALAMGLGFVLSFGYWCTDFLVVQRAMAADSMTSARRTPLIAAIPKMFFPFLVILPGLIAIALPTPTEADMPPGAPASVVKADTMGKGIIPAKVDSAGEVVVDTNGKPVLDYDLAIPNMLLYYFPTGILGLGLTALLASFMSGMAGNITAFNTVWTFDIYQAYIKPEASDKHYLRMGHFATFFGTVVSIAAAYVATQFNNIMELLQLVFAFVNAPLFATFMLGMFWKRATANGAFYGLVAGISAAAIHHGLTLPEGASASVKGGWIHLVHTYRNEMAQNFWTAIWAWTTCFVVTIVISLFTRPRKDEELVGLVYSLTKHDVDEQLPWYKRPAVLGVVVLLMTLALNLIFM
ncbi:sodium:solute symporter family protein [Planctomyces sp. SH-PL62]|uniref:sodium:solute symporter family protein n=1 Tax=Planctomyces sp. SH-PL62 TaxID=1636152 RepID=UPI00078C9B49|nr:sodium:solute symporter family protein [Planctomyces sp. SH-PL62]AMV37072.1 Sodium/glucose cotransporter [Planctomyces sp. SH-PL62]